LEGDVTAPNYRYAGLQRVQSAGLSVAMSAERLRRFAYTEQRLMRLLASRIVSIPERDIKVLLGRCQYEAALRADSWRQRIMELRIPKGKLEAVPDPALATLFDVAEHLPGSYPFLAAVSNVLLPALRQAHSAYIASANDLADYASVRLARQALLELEQHAHLLAAARAGLEATYGRRDAIPMRDYEGVFAMEAPPLEQYAVLGLEVEGKNMRYPPGKRQEWEFARDTARHPLATAFQDFDWADEVLHVNIARRQLETWFPGGLKQIGEFARQGKEHRSEVKHRQAPTAIPRPPGVHK